MTLGGLWLALGTPEEFAAAQTVILFSAFVIILMHIDRLIFLSVPSLIPTRDHTSFHHLYINLEMTL
jgi:hypothetical protein